MYDGLLTLDTLLKTICCIGPGGFIPARGGRYYLWLDFRFTEFSEVRMQNPA
jgi:hypothetical protein